jgi:hypothetical protein
MRELATICCFCEKVRDDKAREPGEGGWHEFNVYMAKYMLRPEAVQLSHAYCPACLAYYKEFLTARKEARERLELEGQL